MSICSSMNQNLLQLRKWNFLYCSVLRKKICIVPSPKFSILNQLHQIELEWIMSLFLPPIFPFSKETAAKHTFFSH